MRLLPKFPLVGTIPAFDASSRAVQAITLNAAIGVILFGIYQSKNSLFQTPKNQPSCFIHLIDSQHNLSSYHL